MTNFDDLKPETQQRCEQEFQELINGISPHELAGMTLEEAYKIGFAKGVEVTETLDI